MGNDDDENGNENGNENEKNPQMTRMKRRSAGGRLGGNANYSVSVIVLRARFNPSLISRF